MGFFVHWKPPHTTTIICFDAPEKLQSLLKSALEHIGTNLDFTDPYSLLSTLIDQVLALYDGSVWSMRNHVCAAEAVCVTPCSACILIWTDCDSLGIMTLIILCCMR